MRRAPSYRRNKVLRKSIPLHQYADAHQLYSAMREAHAASFHTAHNPNPNHRHPLLNTELVTDNGATISPTTSTKFIYWHNRNYETHRNHCWLIGCDTKHTPSAPILCSRLYTCSSRRLPATTCEKCYNQDICCGKHMK